MLATNVNDIKDRLRQRQEQLSATKHQLQADLVTVDEELGRVEAAFAILSGAPIAAAPAKPAKKASKKSLAPSASKILVTELLAKELAHGNAVPETELKARIERQLIESGYDRKGLALRFKEALTESKFHQGADGISFKRRSSLSQPNGVPGDEQKTHEVMNT